jgi:hypothetical protein
VFADWAAETPGAPGRSTLQRHGGFTRFMNEARRVRTMKLDDLSAADLDG